MSSPSKTVFIVCGPTAVGKTAVAIELAKALETEIINADSRQVYAELNIGVAKPSQKELQEIKHHLIGTVPVTRLYGAGDFEKDALAIANEHFKNHNCIVLCGGTGMYLKAFCEGLDDLPKADEIYRAQLKESVEKNGIQNLQALLREKDPAAVDRIDFENPQRLMRALEIIHAGGKLYSELLQGKKMQREFKIVKIGLTMDRSDLYARINTRVDEMMKKGLLEEVKSLRVYRDQNALKTVGYNELFDYIDDKMQLKEAIEKIRQHTRNYAKRQLTWFRSDTEINWFHLTDNKTVARQCAEIINFAQSRLN
jgi:tRNA dimethylallyltransferase